MANLYARIQKRCKSLAENWKNDSLFSKKLAVLRFTDDVSGRLGLGHLSAYAHEKKERFILQFLQDELAMIIDRYRNDTYTGEKTEPDAPIWICWWSGEDTAPDLVKQCIRSIRKNAGSHPVNLVDAHNYKNYLDIPEVILGKLHAGKMKTAHFADYLRVCLIEKYGGLWLDSTIFSSKTIPEEYFDRDFFTCKSPVKKGYYLSDFQWTTFCLGGHKHHVFYRFMKESFECYWSKENAAIDYLFFDDLIYIAKETIPAIEAAIDGVPINNLRRDDLQAAMNAACPGKDFWNVVQEDTVLYKLSWREAYLRSTLCGEQTVFDYMLKMKF